jgi:ribosomal protein L16 Arg81 hydroxylase
MQLDLEWLLSPIDVATFSQQYWGQLPLRIARDCVNYNAPLLGEAEVEFVLHAACRDGDALDLLSEDDARQSCRSHERAVAELRRGKSLRVDSLQRYSGSVALLCRSLERVINCPINVNLYLSPGTGKKALRRHYDTHDVFVLQLHGNKRWRIFDAPQLMPLEFLPLQRHESMQSMRQHRLGFEQKGGDQHALTDEFVLRAGDCLYLPRGYWHEAECEPGKVSCHLTIGIQPTTYLDVLAVALSKAALTESRLRESLPFGFATRSGAWATVESHVDSLLKDLPERLDTAGALDEVAAHFLRSRRSGFENSIFHSLDQASMAAVNADSVLRVRRGLPCAVLKRGHQVRMVFGSQEFAIPTSYEEACRFIAAAPRFAVEALPGDLTVAEKLGLARQLLAEGLLVPEAAPTTSRAESVSLAANWWPTRLDLRAAAVHWIEVGTRPLSEPFVHQTIKRLRREQRSQKITGLQALHGLTGDLAPSGFIFHISRCGSTLLANGLKAIPNTEVVSEPQPVSTALAACSGGERMRSRTASSVEDPDRLLDGLINAYGRRRTGEEQALVFKLSSWNILHIATIRRLWPQVPCIIVIRDPVEVAVSCLENPPGWMLQGAQREAIEALLGPDSRPESTVMGLRFCARTLAAFLKCAASQVDAHCRVIDYRDLTPRAIADVARFLGIVVSEGGIGAIQASCRVYSKRVNSTRVFTGDQKTKQAKAGETLRHELSEYIGGLYQQLLLAGSGSHDAAIEPFVNERRIVNPVQIAAMTSP